MKRRKFILCATSSAGILLLNGAKAGTPCAPLLSGAGGSVICTPADAEADWQARISAPGVVWYHDFRSKAEVDAFRWTGGYAGGNDPNDVGGRSGTVRHLTSDGITGACLEIFRPAGSGEGSTWWRPLSPLDSGSGKPVDDPAANGSMSVQSWAATNGGSQTADWQPGYYGHSSYHSSHPGRFDGEDYYFQVRVKMSPARASQPNGGKLFYFTITPFSNSAQEINTESGQSYSGVNYFSMYRSGSPPLEGDTPGSGNQTGNELGICDWPDNVANCWSWSGGWDTLLYHVAPGRNGNSDTLVQVWAAHPGETSYTKIWDQDNVDLPFEIVQGHNALICSGYQNGLSFSSDVYHRYCQLIFSKNFIPCPLV